ncbi:unnamed protein product, partial [Adineta steineri]
MSIEVKETQSPSPDPGINRLISKELCNNTTLHCLNLSNNHTSLNGIQALASSINQSALKVIALNSLGITDEQ